jgi:hypothetical protein
MALLPILITSSIIGINEFGLKVSYFFCYILFLGFIYLGILKKTLDIPTAIGCTLAIASIPLLFDMSTVIEHALFGYLFIATFLIYVSISDKINFYHLFSFIVIGSFFRQSVLLFTIPALLFFIKENNSLNTKLMLISIGKIIFPCILLLPLVVNSILFGTPATGVMSDFIKLNPIFEILESGFLIDQTKKIFHIPLIILFIFLFIPLTYKTIINKIIIFIYFISLLILYFSISPGLWSNPKYQAEYIAPFISLSLILISCSRFSINFRKLFLILIYSIFIFNILCVLNFTKFKLEKDNISINYPYKLAYNKITSLKLNDNTFSVGITYGTLPEIIYSYTGNSWITVNDKYLIIKNLKLDQFPFIKADVLNELPNNNILLIQGGVESENLLPFLLSLGWQHYEILKLNSNSPKIYVLNKQISE